MNTALLAALGPAAVAILAFEVFCLHDLITAAQVRYVPRWAWAAISLLSAPLGGLLYLLAGRSAGR